MISPVLALYEFGVRFGTRVVLQDLELELPPRGVTALMGPGGVGKSTLIRTICRLNDVVDYMATTGQTFYRGEPISPTRCPVMVTQRLPLLMYTVQEALAQHLPDRASLTPTQQRDYLATYLSGLGLDLLIKALGAEALALDGVSRRLLALAQGLLADPALLCVDEPTSELDDADAAPILALLQAQGEQRAILFVTHNQRHARQIAQRAALLAGGRILEEGLVPEFFDAPRHDATRSYVTTGGCDVPPPGLRPSEEEAREEAALLMGAHDEPPLPQDAPIVVASQVAPAPQQEEAPLTTSSASGRLPEGLAERFPSAPRFHASASVGPRGFHWLVPGVLGGAARPGIVMEIGIDLDALRRVGVTHLITLTESPLPTAPFEGRAMVSRFFPIDDMGVPTLEDAGALCAEVDAWIEAGGCVAFHCKAGMGRTGVMLAAMLVWRQLPAEQALALTRQAYVRWIQSVEQEQFLVAFERWLGQREGASPPL